MTFWDRSTGRQQTRVTIISSRAFADEAKPPFPDPAIAWLTRFRASILLPSQEHAETGPYGTAAKNRNTAKMTR